MYVSTYLRFCLCEDVCVFIFDFSVCVSMYVSVSTCMCVFLVCEHALVCVYLLMCMHVPV